MPEETPKIAIAIPMYNTVTSVFFKSFLSFFIHSVPKYRIQLITIDSTVVDVARNTLVQNFLDSDSDYLLFLDSDIVFPANLLDVLLKHEKDVVSALYFARKKITPVCRLYKDGNYVSMPIEELPKKTLFKVDASGLGCVLIKRKVIEALDKKKKDKPLFKVDYKSRTESRGEDIYFFDLIRKEGFEVFVDTGLVVGHYGGIIPEAVFKNFIY